MTSFFLSTRLNRTRTEAGYPESPYEGYVTDTKIAIQAIMPEVYEPVPGEVVAYGLSLENSDFGNGALSVRAYLLRIWCTNLAITQEEMRQVHLGKRLDSERTYELDAQTTVSALKDVIQRQLNAGQLQQRTRKTTGPMCTRSHLDGERMKGVGGFRQRLSAPPVAGHRPALSAHCTTGTLSFSIATRRDRAAAPKAASTFGRGAPSENN